MLEKILKIFENGVLGTAILAYVVASILKVVFVLLSERKFDFKRLFGTGGMPSAHAAFVMSLAIGVGLQEGFDSPVFALAAVFAIVVMYDASGVRRAAGKQAELLNVLVTELFEEGKLPRQEQLKELLGHSPLQVLAGAALGIAMALLLG